MNFKISLILLTVLISLTGQAQKNTKVFYVELEEGKEITAQPIREFKQESEINSQVKINLYPNIEMQEIEGIGGAFNEIGGLALMSLPKTEREKVMQNLFGNDNAHFTFCRTAIGASDFGASAYSYSEVADDYKMEHFSLAREEKSVIPYIQTAFRYNPQLKLFASPWSPPGWMKHSGVMDQGNITKEKNKLKDTPEIYEAYALYFSKYIQSYEQKGITVDRLLIQNETDANTKYPSCVMVPEQMNQLAKLIRQRFEKDKIKSEIWAGTFRTVGVVDAIEIAANQEFMTSFDGIGIQYTKTKYISDMNLLANGKPTMHTEGVCFNGKNSIEQAFTRLDEVASYINYGIPNYCYWNMILDETGKSGWNWRQNSLINIDKNNKTVTYNPDYSVIYLLSKYLQPGSKRIISISKENLISVKKDGTIYLFVQNKSDKTKNYLCTEKGETLTQASIPANSVAVIVINAN